MLVIRLSRGGWVITNERMLGNKEVHTLVGIFDDTEKVPDSMISELCLELNYRVDLHPDERRFLCQVRQPK